MRIRFLEKLHAKTGRLPQRKWDYIFYTGGFLLAFLLYRRGNLPLSGCLLLLLALGLYLLNYYRTQTFVNLRGLLSLSWLGGIGLSVFQLSNLQTNWSNETWGCFYSFYLLFLVGYDFSLSHFQRKQQEHLQAGAFQGAGGIPGRGIDIEAQTKQVGLRMQSCILLLLLVSCGAFLLEACVLQYIPLFSSKPHAYSYFHLTGIHYFTVSCSLLPALCVLYRQYLSKWTRTDWLLVVTANVAAVGIPILCVSRFQLLFAVGFGLVVYVFLYRDFTWKRFLGFVCALLPVYILLTIARNHDVSYLNGIFDMKYENMPIFITQPYMYIANNFENFQCLTANLPAHTWGLKMGFWFFTLSGLKFRFPWLVNFPLYTTKPELTTVTILYDAYYDFGIVGVIAFGFLLGCGAAFLANQCRQKTNPIRYLFYGQYAMYMSLSFFTTWFSNPTTWFWFLLTGGMYWWVGRGASGRRKSPGKEARI